MSLLTACHRTAKRVDGLIAAGKYAEAEALLYPMVTSHPGDRELHFLMGKVLLYRDYEPIVAEHQFDLAGDDAKWKKKIARAYADAFDVLLRNDDAKAGDFIVRAVRADESLKDEACRRLTTEGDQRDADGKVYRGLVNAEATIGGPCAADAIKHVQTMISASDRILDIGWLTSVWIRADSRQLHDAAVYLRGTAQSLQQKNRKLAQDVLLLAIRFDPTIDGDLETKILRSELGVNGMS